MSNAPISWESKKQSCVALSSTESEYIAITEACKEAIFSWQQCSLSNIPYRQLIGGLMYLATTSRPDISYAVSYLSRFLDRVTEETWTAGKRVLRFLQGTKTLGLTYTKHTNSDVILEGYSDADWATDKKSRKSVSGSIILYGNNPISWSSKKQTCVALSTAEAEYVAAAQTAQDLINVKALSCREWKKSIIDWYRYQKDLSLGIMA
ncbi:uncharacterized protein LOC130451898 [Diorhabda sublineata]|uniref:uncharacterized protein LOC130451898 n=1 Tax=Diorhabda sublineata TaxID=1163346 RepID=UPI0024E14300|nr:uncharacterized protein LOC130451898 [Diorhabda sublineata]